MENLFDSENLPKILIVDEHYVCRLGLKCFLMKKHHIPKVDEAENGLMALEMNRVHHYDILFMDIDLSILDGAEVCRLIKKENPKVKVVVITAVKKMYTLMQAFESGIWSLIPKYSEPTVFNAAIEKILKGGQFFIPEFQKPKKKLNMDGFEPVLIKKLSPNEKKIVMLICEQFTSYQISDQLGLSKSTIDTYRKRIFKKLNVLNSVGVVIYAIRTGLYQVET